MKMIGKQIKKHLHANQMTQSELALKMNVSDSKLSKIINGSTEPNLTDLRLLSEILNVSTDELIKGEDSVKRSSLEMAVMERKDPSLLLLNRKKILDFKDDSSRNLIHYALKHNAYDYLYQLYKIDPTLVDLQVHYVKIIRELIYSNQYEAYQALIQMKFNWDIVSFFDNEKDLEKLNTFAASNSRDYIHEVVKHDQESVIKTFMSKQDYGVITLNKHIIYSCRKTQFLSICEVIIKDANLHPKWIDNRERRESYYPLYLSKNKPELMTEWKLFIENKQLNFSRKALKEALIKTNQDDLFYEMMGIEIDRLEDIDLSQILKTQSQYTYDSKCSTVKGNSNSIKDFLRLAVEHDKIELFIRLITHPMFDQFIRYATQEQKVYGEYKDYFITPKIFDFKCPFHIQKEIINLLPSFKDEISIDLKEVISLESKDDFEFALSHLQSNDYFYLGYHAEGLIESTIKRTLSREDKKRINDQVISTFQEFNNTYLETGKIDTDGIFRSLQNKAVKNPLLKLFLLKMWIQLGDYDHNTFTESFMEQLKSSGVEMLESIKSQCHKVISHLFLNLPSYVDNVFRDQKLYILLPQINDLSYFKFIIEKFNPAMFGKVIEDNQLLFQDIDRVKYLYGQITNELLIKDMALLNRSLLI